MKNSLIVILLCLSSCSTRPAAPPPANVASAPALNNASADQLSKASAAAEAADYSNGTNVDSPAKVATAGELSVVRSYLPISNPLDRTAAMKRVNAALTGKLDEANAGWEKARGEAVTLQAQIKTLTDQVQHEREAAAAELQRQLTAARDEERQKAEAREKLLVTGIFFGLGALCLLGAVAVIALKATVPIFGPEAAFYLGIAGGMLIGTGILIRAINRLIEDHPYIFWGGLLTAVLAVVAALAIMRANHFHSVTAAKPA